MMMDLALFRWRSELPAYFLQCRLAGNLRVVRFLVVYQFTNVLVPLATKVTKVWMRLSILFDLHRLRFPWAGIKRNEVRCLDIWYFHPKISLAHRLLCVCVGKHNGSMLVGRFSFSLLVDWRLDRRSTWTWRMCLLIPHLFTYRLPQIPHTNGCDLAVFSILGFRFIWELNIWILSPSFHTYRLSQISHTNGRGLGIGKPSVSGSTSEFLPSKIWIESE